MKGSLYFLFIFFFSTLWAQKISIEQYIETYKDIAIQEMHRAKIPASITLAQGILESGSGNSKLAVNANNHFGIKCHSDWIGPKAFHDDDAKHECFRKYKSASESYIDHSNFLTGKKRYAFLFELKKDDYVSWSHGLKKAGYATNPKYPQLLIKIIEDHKLNQYDSYEKALSSKISTINNIPVHFCGTKESPLELAHKYNIKLSKLSKINEWGDKHQLSYGEIVFLKKKKRKCPHKTHKANGQENILEIAQKYGIKSKFICKRNSYSIKYIPAKGEKISLLKKAKKSLNPQTYIVKQGDTLYSISKRYNLSVERIKQINKIDGTLLKTGMKLKLN